MLQIKAQHQGVISQRIVLYGFEKNYRDGGFTDVLLVQPVTMQPATELTDPDPFLTLDITAAQLLMDSLWDCGLRPSEGSGSAGALLATQNHLKDVQATKDRLLSMVEKGT